MRVAEFRELVDGLADARRSLQSGVHAERDNEVCRVQQWVRELRESDWPTRLTDCDRSKAIRVMDMANDAIAETFATE